MPLMRPAPTLPPSPFARPVPAPPRANQSLSIGRRAAPPAALDPAALADNCPFNMFRTGIDISPSPLSVVSNLMDASRCVP